MNELTSHGFYSRYFQNSVILIISDVTFVIHHNFNSAFYSYILVHKKTMADPVFIALVNPKSGGKVGPELLQKYVSDFENTAIFCCHI